MYRSHMIRVHAGTAVSAATPASAPSTASASSIRCRCRRRCCCVAMAGAGRQGNSSSGSGKGPAAPSRRRQQPNKQQQQQHQQQVEPSRRPRETLRLGGAQPRPRRSVQPLQPSPTPTPPQQPAPPNALDCPHFGACPGCTLAEGLERPPLAGRATAFFSSLRAHGALGEEEEEPFEVVAGPLAGWRCRAKLAVRGGPGGLPVVGLFRAGSHDAVDVPACRTHHPRINEAAELLRRALASGSHPGAGPYDEATGRGAVRYAQFTALPTGGSPCGLLEAAAGGAVGGAAGGGAAGGGAAAGAAAGRAEDDPMAVVQLALVVNAPGMGPGAAEAAEGLAKALWREAGGGDSGGGGGSDSGQQRLPLLHSVWLNFQPARGNAIFGREWRLVAGPPVGWQDFGGAAAAVGPGGFVQANFGAMRSALAAIADAVPEGSRVAELYAGSGAIGLSLAAAGRAERVVCVEVNPECRGPFEAARAALPPEAAARVSFVTASAGDDPSRWLEGSDVAVVDPPRRGLDAALLGALLGGGGSGGGGSSGGGGGEGAGGAAVSGPAASDPLVAAATAATATSTSTRTSGSTSTCRRLVYLSCGYAALERDAAALVEGGWRCVSARAFVFFPGADHLETLAVFDRP